VRACRVGSTKAHEILREVIESGESPEDGAWRDRIVQLEEGHSQDLDLRARPGGAWAPVVSVLGLSKGGAAAREQPKPEGAPGQPSR